jgi:hypothetical protein
MTHPSQAGIIRFDSIVDFSILLRLCLRNENDWQLRRKVPNGNRGRIVTNAGGPGIVANVMTVSSGCIGQSKKKPSRPFQPSATTANVHNPWMSSATPAQEPL